jgi:hypothetical protein
MRKLFLIASVAALTGLPTAAWAQPTPAELYQQALQSLAEGRKGEASAAFAKVIEYEPLNAGAWMEIALIQCSLGRSADAEHLFKQIELRFNPPPGIRALIAQARARGCAQWQPYSQSALLLGRGYDQNVNQGASSPHYSLLRDGVPETHTLLPEFLPRADQYTALTAEYLRELTGNGTMGFVQFQARRNDRLSQFDSAAVFLGAEAARRFGGWTGRASATAGLVTLGGHMFQRQAQLQGRIGAPLALYKAVNFDLVASYSHLQYQTLLNFDANTVDFKGQLAYRKGPTALTLTAGPARDHAVGDRPGGDRKGWTATAQARRGFGEGITAELQYQVQSWHSERIYSEQVINVRRKQETHIVRASVMYPISRNQNIQLEARKVWNKENIPVFQYNTGLLQLSWQWTGF